MSLKVRVLDAIDRGAETSLEIAADTGFVDQDSIGVSELVGRQ